MKTPSWEEYFLTICRGISQRSKDEDTKLGCVIADERHRIVSTGYNSLPAGVDDNYWPTNREAYLFYIDDIGIVEDNQDIPKGAEKITKYDVMAHAEINALVSAARSLVGCTLYCTYLPCCECAKAIITAGIKSIIYEKENPRFKKSHAIAKKLFDQAGIKYGVWKLE
jgi:dCMP deaminase